MCSRPVTLGGGIMMQYGPFDPSVGANHPLDSHCSYQRCSMALGSYVLFIECENRYIGRSGAGLYRIEGEADRGVETNSFRVRSF